RHRRHGQGRGGRLDRALRPPAEARTGPDPRPGSTSARGLTHRARRRRTDDALGPEMMATAYRGGVGAAPRVARGHGSARASVALAEFHDLAASVGAKSAGRWTRDELYDRTVMRNG